MCHLPNPVLKVANGTAAWVQVAVPVLPVDLSDRVADWGHCPAQGERMGLPIANLGHAKYKITSMVSTERISLLRHHKVENNCKLHHVCTGNSDTINCSWRVNVPFTACRPEVALQTHCTPQVRLPDPNPPPTIGIVLSGTYQVKACPEISLTSLIPFKV